MAAWAAKRFWTDTSVVNALDGYTIHLDARPVHTPIKTPLIVPTRALAAAIAAEWHAQSGIVNPETMPFTRMANSALDKVAPQFDEVVELLAAYGASDLLCYRANGPARLIDRQARAWDPVLDWATSVLGAPLRVTTGVIPIAQPPESVAVLSARVKAFTPFQLAAVHDLVSITGSLVLTLAVTEGWMSLDAAWAAARVDEIWQAEVWGEDETAAGSESLRHAAFLHSGRFFTLCG